MGQTVCRVHRGVLNGVSCCEKFATKGVGEERVLWFCSVEAARFRLNGCVCGADFVVCVDKLVCAVEVARSQRSWVGMGQLACGWGGGVFYNPNLRKDQWPKWLCGQNALGYRPYATKIRSFRV